MLKDGSRVQEVTNTTGTGPLSLLGAPTGYTRFDAQIGSDNEVLYWLFDADGVNWECGRGTVLAGNTLTRDSIIESTRYTSGTPDKIVLSAGTHTVLNAPVPGFVKLKRYIERVHRPSISSNVVTLDLSEASVFYVEHNANCTISFSNVQADIDCVSVTLIMKQSSSGGKTLTFPASVKWSGGVPPLFSTGPNAYNVFTLFTFDNGTTWLSHLAGKDYS